MVPSIVVDASTSVGRLVVTEMLHQSLPPPSVAFVGSAGTNRMAFAPTMALAFWMNWRSEPCTVRLAPVSSSRALPPSVVVTTLNEKP